MARVLLDSSFIIELLVGNPKAEHAFTLAVKQGAELCTSVVCQCEVLNFGSGTRQDEARGLLARLLVFPVTREDALLACKIQDACRAKGGQVQSPDALVAATAIHQNATLFARDSDFERMPGLTLENLR